MKKLAFILSAILIALSTINNISADFKTPSVPKITSFAVSEQTLTLKWTGNADKYEIEYKKSSAKSFKILKTTEKKSFSIKLSAGNYNFRIAAKNLDGDKEKSSEYSKTIDVWIKSNDEIIKDLFDSKTSDVQVRGVGTVIKTLNDDSDGSRHQRFILKLSSGQTLLIAHNVDIAPRLNSLKVGDKIEFYGEYYYNEQGGGVHWTHKDPNKKHIDGYLELNGKKYQ